MTTGSATDDDDLAHRVAAFSAGYGFPLDAFQRDAIASLVAGRSVLVAAPTGAGKTVVGEFACSAALTTGAKCFYTTPIKALSNQKHRDLGERHGAAAIGLLTGDRSVNGDAPVVVMTTEVLRNMLYEASPTLDGLRYVVLDEVHYLADRERGGVWEEVIIQLPQHVQLAALSATVSNAEELGDWMATVRDGCDVVIEERRPVPLRHHYFVNDRVYPTFRTGAKGGASQEHRERAAQALAGVPNPDVLMLERRSHSRPRMTRRGPRQTRSDVRLRWPSRVDVVTELSDRGWLPAIVFVFSRQGCEDAVDQLVRAGLQLTDADQRAAIATVVDTLLAGVPDDDLVTLGVERWRAALLAGIAAHHAGLVPVFKEAVERCFQQGLLAVVVATETLALGINMPAKTVVIERLEKWNGDQHVMLTPGEYTQLTGRAGRRGLDRVGHAVVLYQRAIDFRTVAGLVGTRTYPLASSFQPSYNLAVNLLRRHDVREAEALLSASFAQFQADRAVAGAGRRLVELQDALRGYSRHLACDRGDWAGYWAVRAQLSRREQREARERRATAEATVSAAIAALRPGAVLHLPWLGRRGLAAVAGVRLSSAGTPLAQLVTDEGALTRVGPRDLERPPDFVARVALPGRGNPRQRQFRREVAQRLRQIDPPATAHARDGPPEVASAEVERLRRELRRHPCHGCPDRAEHERWQRRYDDVERDTDRLRRSIEQQTGSIVRRFHRILAVLRDLGYVNRSPAAPVPTEDGLLLAGIYSDVDLLVAECLRHGVFDDLDAAELAGVAALFLYEPRGGEPTPVADMPTPGLAAVAARVGTIAEDLRAREAAARVDATRELDGGFVTAAWRWASGADLDTAMATLDLTGGDFVRIVKQVADLLGQIRDVARRHPDGDLGARAGRAVDGLRRGIVEA